MLSLQPPGSKSMTQRALVIASLADRKSTIAGALDCDDSRYLVHVLRGLGTGIEANWSDGEIHITPAAIDDTHDDDARPKLLKSDGQTFFCGNAGTAIRFSSALSLICEGSLTLDGDERMRGRPIGGLADALSALGVKVSFLRNPGYPPLRLEAGDAIQHHVVVDSSQSSQFASGLLLVAPHLPAGLVIKLAGKPVSQPYLDMTVRMMRRAGANAAWIDNSTLTVGRSSYTLSNGAGTQLIEPDWSAAAFLLAAKFVTKTPLEIPNLIHAPDSLQGDAVFEHFLRELALPRAHTFDLTDAPDLIAPLAAAALFAEHISHVTGAAHTRIKESDRIAVLCRELRKVGARIDERPDGMVIHPLERANTTIAPLDPANDHRMAMSFGIVSLCIPHLTINNQQCVSKSYPEFWSDLERIRRASRNEL